MAKLPRNNLKLNITSCQKLSSNTQRRSALIFPSLSSKPRLPAATNSLARNITPFINRLVTTTSSISITSNPTTSTKMSTSSTTATGQNPHNRQPSPTTPTPWLTPFLSHLHSLPPPSRSFTLSTLHPLPPSFSSTSTPTPFSSTVPVLPRARTCIYRGLWAQLPTNDKNPAELNPWVFESDLITFTTDARMEKAAEIVDTASGERIEEGGGMTGGGGPVEAVFWIESARDSESGEEKKVMTQWRVRGTAWLLGPDADGEGAAKVREALRQRMRRVPDKTPEDEKTWSWSKEVTAHFGNLSPVMRGTFKGPPPGQPVSFPPGKGEELGQEVEDLQDEVARRNFRVVVIVPTEVDQVDLSDARRPRRWLYLWRGKSYQAREAGGEVEGEWEKVEVWP
ncbi:hypothetical protein QBC32DRAFT_391677 [Pseudoneurospora amorphoporcata]|uniref:Pyridoxamine 5'-phosphate oxidase Alr4036 family FMN-binding domain-containing protein n=1 Tax=Pseudoneurospora amorphoporcata TaxID=241081 RepID=A0AAN6SJ28_9PEZI|nr:hypothetical protein QBC32DRAFT_391677 [Pseudoneurospora amorphoporcata]